LIQEADAITAATGNAPFSYASLVLAAWRGEETQALNLIDASVKDATARGEGTVLGLAGYVTAVLYNGLGRYDAALAGAQQASAHDDFLFAGWSLAELVEAGVRNGAHPEAAAALTRLQERTRASGTDWALGIQARCDALLSDGGAAEARYREAVERLERSRVAIHLARAHLVYGEWLRREHRRRDAREQLRTAYELLSTFGAEAFAERARRELQATGETVRKRTVGTLDTLTAQETQIARLAGDGLTNPEIGAQLFISPHTVEWHLRKVFNKLGITSRRQLRGMMPVAAGRATST
jgi:DNA-binding CsgD family transcriptional regulator